jgi:hypothetical protein
VEDESRGCDSPVSTLQVGEMTGQVTGGLSGKSEEGCVQAAVHTRDRGDSSATAFREADGGGDGDISGGRGQGELGTGIS